MALPGPSMLSRSVDLGGLGRVGLRGSGGGRGGGGIPFPPRAKAVCTVAIKQLVSAFEMGCLVITAVVMFVGSVAQNSRLYIS